MQDHECEYKQRVIELEARVSELETALKMALQKIEELTAELAKYKKPPKNSSNSGTPASQDPYRKYPKREKSSRSNGGQSGHKGHHRPCVEKPDEIEYLYPEHCLYCKGEHLIPLADWHESCQEVDIPPIQPVVKEYRACWSKCATCGKKSKAQLPGHLNPPVQLGPRITALTGYLKVCHHLSHQRISQLFSDVLGLSISQGSVENHLQRLSFNLSSTIESIRQALRTSWIVGSDETRNRINGKNGYTWVFHTQAVCLFVSTGTRSYEVIEKVFGEQFPLVWVSDRYNAQLKVPCQHQLCLVHIVRNLQYAIDSEQSAWAHALQTLLRETMHFRKQHADNYDPLEPNTFRHIKRFEEKLLQLFTHPPPQEEERKLFQGLLARQKQLLYFLHDPHVPFENNASERALRNRVIHRKVIGGFRMMHGSQAFDTISSDLPLKIQAISN